MSEIRSDAPHDTTEIEILETNERWSEYGLADGTVLRLRPVMIAVFRADGGFGSAYRQTASAFVLGLGRIGRA